MLIEEAIELLNRCTRSELRDHAFGDREVTWLMDGVMCADGYFNGSVGDYVHVVESSHVMTTGDDFHADVCASFTGADAQRLATCGAEVQTFRNDVSGPEVYEEGHTQYGLTLGGVYEELTGNKLQTPEEN